MFRDVSVLEKSAGEGRWRSSQDDSRPGSLSRVLPHRLSPADFSLMYSSGYTRRISLGELLPVVKINR